MNVFTTEIALLSALFYLLGLGTLAITGFKPVKLKYIASYAVAAFIASVLLAHPKWWMLLSSIVFMIMASYYSLYVLYGQLKECFVANKESNTQQQGDGHDNG